ncbi:MAG: DUF805 domain-containing protein, partial [Bacteroidota bacterium]
NAKEVKELKKFFKVEKIIVQPIKTAPTHDPVIASPAPTFEQKKMFSAPFSFKGRIRRTEYGVSAIIYFIAYSIVIAMLESFSFMGIAIIPIIWFFLAQGAKRCHDRGNSGWYQLIPFYYLWMLFGEGDQQANSYGNPVK